MDAAQIKWRTRLDSLLWQIATDGCCSDRNQISARVSEGGMIWLETLIELKLLNSSFSSSNYSIRACRAYYITENRHDSLSSNSRQQHLSQQVSSPLLVLLFAEGPFPQKDAGTAAVDDSETARARTRPTIIEYVSYATMESFNMINILHKYAPYYMI